MSPRINLRTRIYLMLGGLVLMAMANREIGMLEVIPPDLAAWFGIQYAIELPLFLVILGGVVVGLLVARRLDVP